MKKKTLHNVAKWPPSAATPWTQTLMNSHVCNGKNVASFFTFISLCTLVLIPFSITNCANSRHQTFNIKYVNV